MRNIKFIEVDSGIFSLKFGVIDFGPEGLSKCRFHLESKEHSLWMEFSGNLFDLFTRYELSPHYFNNACVEKGLIKIYEEKNSCMVEARSGVLYDLLKESAVEASGVFRSKKPITFYWRGHQDFFAA